MYEYRYKLDEIMMYLFEELVLRHFRKCHERYTEKNMSEFYFMSDRFYKLYEILLKKDPNIELPGNVITHKKNISKNGIVYLNDIDSEMPKMIRRKDKMYLCSINDDLNYKTWNFPKEQYDIDQQRFDNILLKKKRDCYFFSGVMTIEPNFLCYEIEYLRNNIITDDKQFNVNKLLPEYYQDYMKFVFEHKEVIWYFIKKFDNMYWDLRCETFIVEKEDILNIKNKIREAALKIFKEEKDIKVIEFLYNTYHEKKDFDELYHYPIWYDFDDIQKRLNDLYQYASKDFDKTKIEDGIVLSHEYSSKLSEKYKKLTR